MTLCRGPSLSHRPGSSGKEPIWNVPGGIQRRRCVTFSHVNSMKMPWRSCPQPLAQAGGWPWINGCQVVSIGREEDGFIIAVYDYFVYFPLGFAKGKVYQNSDFALRTRGHALSVRGEASARVARNENRSDPRERRVDNGRGMPRAHNGRSSTKSHREPCGPRQSPWAPGDR